MVFLGCVVFEDFRPISIISIDTGIVDCVSSTCYLQKNQFV